MENNLMDISIKYHQLKSEMLHGGYSGEMLENHIIDVISDEILSKIGEIERYNDVKNALVNMFFSWTTIKIIFCNILTLFII